MAITNNLLAFYKLDNTNDSSGNGRTLTNNGNVSFASGKLGNAASFDGSNQLQVVNPIAEGTQYSVAGCVKFSNFDSLQFAFSFGSDMGVLYHNGVEPAEVIFTTSVGSYIGAGTPSANDWHFIYASRKANGDYAISIDNGALVTGNAGETYYGTFEIGNLLNGSMDAVGIWSRSLTESEITELYNSGTGLELEVPNLTSGLQAFYKLNDLTDSSGNNRTLTNNGNVSFASGKLGNAATFVGNQAEHYLSKSEIISDSSLVSIAGWCRYTAEGVAGYAFMLASETGRIDVVCDSYQGGRLVLDTENDLPICNMVPAQNEWHHFAIVVSAGVAKGYIDGALLGVQANSLSGAANLIIGSSVEWAGSGSIYGQVDGLGVWNRALNDAEVAALYNNGNGLELGTLTKIQGKAKFYGKVKFGV